MSVVGLIFPDWGCSQQSSPFWTVKPYCEVFRKQQVMFPSGKPFSGHQPADKPLKTIKGHLEKRSHNPLLSNRLGSMSVVVGHYHTYSEETPNSAAPAPPSSLPESLREDR